MKKSPIPLTRTSVFLYEGDMSRLMEIAGTKIGASRIIREAVRKFIREHEAKAAARLTPAPQVEVDL